MIKEYKRGRDLELLIRTRLDDISKTKGLKEPTIAIKMQRVRLS